LLDVAMVPSRRALLRTTAATLLVGVAGCLDAVRSGRVGVRIDNRDDRSHAVDVRFAADGDPVAEESFDVPAGTEATFDDVVAAGEYEVTVAVDAGARTTVPFAMNGCPDNALFVAVDDEGTLEADVLDEC
jgi:hypothetical protein